MTSRILVSFAILGFVLGVSVTPACGGATTSTSTSTTTAATSGDGTSGTSTSSGTDATTTGTTSTTTATTGSTSTSSTTAPRRRRATIAPERLQNCTPEGASLTNVTPVRATFGDMLGGCGFTTDQTVQQAQPNEILFDVFSEVAPVANLLVCSSGHAAQLDFRNHTYGTLSTVHSTIDRWEVVFAVDDGERVHLGARLVHGCSGVAPGTARMVQSLDIEGGERAVTLYRCAPQANTCPPLP